MVRDAGEPVDYAYISVRNLGTIYEGLLENRLVVDPRPEGFSKILRVSLVNDKGERKLSGSYYTPDFIVKYIVGQTLDPILEERGVRFTAAMDRIADLHKKLRNALDTMTNQRLQAQLADAEREALDAFLGIKCCDPAMGSGHFLVNAVDHLTDGIIRRMQVYHDTHLDVPWDWNPVQRLIERVRREILAEMAGQGIVMDSARLDDTALLTRLVMKRCIYGVDLNPLAVELAKLSLWLHSFTIGAPLSFLDHHLRWGNSLIGSDDVRKYIIPGTERWNELLRCLTYMVQVSEMADATYGDVAESSRIYLEARKVILPSLRRLHAELAQVFDASLKPMGLAVQLAYMSDEDRLKAPEETQRKYEAAQRMATEKGFFHWYLEFPEVFIALRGRDWAEDGGFDAMIGNPPYVRQESLAPFKPFLAANFAEFYHGAADLFVYFFGQGLRQLRQGGRLAYISSNSWLRANYAAALRAYLRTQATIETLVDIGDNHIFEDAADVYPAIPIVRKLLPPPDHAAQVAVFTRGEGVRQFAAQVAAKLTPVAIHDQPDAGWQLGDEAGRRIFAKLMTVGRPLDEVVEGRIFFGIKTGLNEAFIIDQATRDRLVTMDPSCAGLVYPMRRGEDLRSWYQGDEGKWLIALPYKWATTTFGAGLDEATAWRALQSRHPALAAHLAPFAEAARKRQDKGEYWWELRPCDYYDAFDAPKIFWPDIAKSPRFVWDDSKTRIGNTAYFTSPATPYLLGVLASRVTWFVISQLSQSFGERAGVQRYRLFTQTMSRLPIPDAPSTDRDAIAGLTLAITEHAVPATRCIARPATAS